MTACLDAAGQQIAAQGVMNADGQVILYLAPGTYYLFRAEAGYVFTDPDTEVVS